MLDELLEGYQVVVTMPISWGDMDAYQHVNNTRYFRYFEDARIAYFERTGITDLAASPTGKGMILSNIGCRFRAPLSYPDEVRVGAKVTAVGAHSFKMEYKLVSVAMHKVAATGSAVVVAFDFEQGRKILLPESWRRALERVENCSFAAQNDDEL